MEGQMEQFTAELLDSSVIFHLTKNILGFILYMHQQIPYVLQDINLEFNALQSEYKESATALTQNEIVRSTRRMHMSKMREIKHGIRRFEKLVNTVSNLDTALQLMLTEIPNVQQVALILGGSPLRPLHVYELCLEHGSFVPKCSSDFVKSKAAEALSRKVIRMLVSKGAGSDSYPGPTNLFLLVKAPPSLNLPLHFLPKRDFRYNKKIVPHRIRFKCKSQNKAMVASDNGSQACTSMELAHSTPDDMIWYQCRHVIKGIAFKTPSEE